MASGNAMVFANSALFDLLLARYVAANPEAMSGVVSAPAIGLKFEFGSSSAPTSDLTPQPSGGNFGIRIPLELQVISLKTGKRVNVADLLVVVSGTVSLQGQAIQLTNLSATGPVDVLDQKAAAMFNEKVLPRLKDAVSRVPLPDLTKVLGVPVQVVGVQVIDRQVAVSAQIAGAGGTIEGATVAPAFPAVMAAISGDAISALARAQFQPVTATAGAHKETAGFGYDAQAEAGAGNPRVAIAGGQAEGTIDVWASAKGGIEVATEWIEPEVGVSTAVPPLGLRLVNGGSGKNLDVKVYLTGSVRVDFGLPSALEEYADEILTALGPIGEAITQKINAALDPIAIHAFTLPATVPGTNVAANLAFASQGFAGNAAVAVVNVG